MHWRQWLFGCIGILALGWAVGQVGASSHDEEHVELLGGRFAPKGTKPKYALDTPFKIKHIRLELKVEPKKRLIDGQALLTMAATGKAIEHVVLHAAELRIKEVWVGKKKVKWQGVGQELHIELGASMAPGKAFVVRVVYSASPRTGMYFVLPGKAYPKRPVMVFTQGETETNRFWFPSWDKPNMRFTSETLFTVRKPLMVVTNGKLLSKKEKDGWITYHHKMKYNHVNYLVAVAIGEFKAFEQSWNKIPIRSYVPPHRFEQAKRSFENTADMMKFFSEKIGFTYPYSKYDQVTVYNFVAGGMENITATILTMATLHDAQAHLDERSDGLVAHELAHQWFGDLLTCKNWSHIWLNESFATYFDKLYVEHKWGQQEFDSQRRRMLHWHWYSRYQRAIQTNRYEFPGDMFDSHSYPKGAAVLHMIRNILGDKLWWKAINHYVTTHAHGLVETSDFRKSLELVSGKNWLPFFDQWIRRPGQPVLKFSWKYNRKTKMVVATLRQTQKLLYRFDSVLVVSNDKKERKVVNISVNKKVQTVTIPYPTRPSLVEFDPREVILKKVKVKKSWQEWLFQLQHGSAMLSQARAAKKLGDFPNRPKVTQALVATLFNEKLHHTLRGDAARGLGKLARDADCAALLKGLKEVKESKVRSVVAGELGHCADAKPLKALAEAMRKDPSYHVRNAAVGSIAKLRDKTSFGLMEEAYKQTQRLGRTRIAALSGMMALEDKRVLKYLKESMKPGKQRRVRTFSMPSYARMVAFFRDDKKDKEDMLLLLPFLKDPDPFVQGSAVSALGVLGDARAVPHLRRFAAQAPTKSTGKRVKRAIKMIYRQGKQSKRLRKLGKDLREIKKAQRKLRKKFEKLERKKTQQKQEKK
ncbi:MAG: hypothetical protein EP343_18125 [Deltaproteobacteria bacterium]|nr:MAG: hypothetical protein EP343_18125 [Deltaproteobacteria bacterium]